MVILTTPPDQLRKRQRQVIQAIRRGGIDGRDDRQKAAMREVDGAMGQSDGSRAVNGARPVSF